MQRRDILNIIIPKKVEDIEFIFKIRIQRHSQLVFHEMIIIKKLNEKKIKIYYCDKDRSDEKIYYY